MVTKEAKLEIDEDKYVEQFKPYLMDVTLAWCKGATFAQICKMTDIFEGMMIALSHRFLKLIYF
jgi:ATP-dependent RNA helicase DOB1